MPPLPKQRQDSPPTTHQRSCHPVGWQPGHAQRRDGHRATCCHACRRVPGGGSRIPARAAAGHRSPRQRVRHRQGNALPTDRIARADHEISRRLLLPTSSRLARRHLGTVIAPRFRFGDTTIVRLGPDPSRSGRPLRPGPRALADADPRRPVASAAHRYGPGLARGFASLPFGDGRVRRTARE